MHGLKSYILEGTYLVLSENQVTRKKNINGIVVSTPHTWALVTYQKRAEKSVAAVNFIPNTHMGRVRRVTNHSCAHTPQPNRELFSISMCVI